MNKPTYEELEMRIKELEKVKETIFEDAKHFNQAFYCAAAGMALVSTEGQFIQINNSLCEILGYSAEELIGKSFNDFTYHEDLQIGVDQLQKMVKREIETSHFEKRYVRKDGTVIYCSLAINLINDSDGLPVHFVTQIMDISERKLAEKRYKTIIMTALDGFWLIDNRGKLLDVNESYCNMTGYSKEELLEMSIMDIDALESESETRDRIAFIIKEGSGIFETKHRCKDGTLFDIEVSTHYFPEEGGQFVAFLKNITNRKKAEKELKVSEEKYRLITENAFDFVWSIDMAMNITYASYSVFRLLGYTQEEVTKIDVREFYPPEAFSKVQSIITEEISKGPSSEGVTFQTTNLRKDKSEFPVEIRVKVIFNEENEPILLQGYTRDISEQKNVEQVLRDSDAKHSALIASISDVIAIIDENGITQYKSQNITEYFGWHPEELIGKDAFITIHPDDKDRIKSEFINILKNSKSIIRTEFKYFCKNGEVKIVELTAKNLLSNPHVNGILVNYKDITSRKIAEEALVESENRYTSLVDQSPLAYVVYDKDGLQLRVNKTFEKLWGSKAEDTVGKFNIRTDSQIEILGLKPFVDKVFSGESVELPEYEWDPKESGFPGRSRWLSSRLYSIKANDGEIMNVINTYEDITERKNAEEALAKEKLRLAYILEGTNAGTWDWNVETGELVVNERWVEIIGSTLEELQPIDIQTWMKHVHPDDFPNANEMLEKHFRKQMDYFDVEFRQPHKNGNWVWVNARGKVAEWTADGKPMRMSGTHLDITERKQLEEQLQIRQRMDSLGTLAGGIAHDFNNMLVGIMGNIDLLLFDKYDLTDTQIKRLQGAEKSCDRAKDLIKQFHTFSKASITEKSSVDIYEIAKEVNDLLNKTTNKLITKNIEFEKGKFYIHANETEINQALLNLCINAAHAIEQKSIQPGDFISINAKAYKADSMDIYGLREGDYIHITVSDTGIGMPEEVMKKAFDPLFTTKDKGGVRGQGLGLAMVFNIVTRIHNGHILIESKEGKGTTFHIYLPKAKQKDTVEEYKTDEMPCGNETILVVDDEEIILGLSHMMLKTLGYIVITVSDGKQALEKYLKHGKSIDAVILDLTMPMISGEMVLRGLLDLNPDVKVIISSGHSEKLASEGILSKAKSKMNKPYKMSELATILRNVLDS